MALFLTSCNISGSKGVGEIKLATDLSDKTLIAGETIPIRLVSSTRSKADFTLSFYDGFESKKIEGGTIKNQRDINWEVPLSLCIESCSLILDIYQDGEELQDTLSTFSVNVNSSEEIESAKSFFPLSNSNEWIYEVRSNNGSEIIVDTFLVEMDVITETEYPASVIDFQFNTYTLSDEEIYLTSNNSSHKLGAFYSVFNPDLVFEKFSASILNTDANNYDGATTLPLISKYKIFVPLAFQPETSIRLDYNFSGNKNVYLVETEPLKNLNFSDESKQAKVIHIASEFYNTKHVFLKDIGLYKYSFGADIFEFSEILLLAAKIDGVTYGNGDLLRDE
ncbi:hypothetical protein [Gracilimonas sediminicola]|uniref:Uncharacterized protein n=1 Tax=Gracilimonas sediminicola TaxID=2952158 RepID=A0A9X2RFE4_9BACT|nr:hypothetical protein [Gracilimonas sediminicola]MCP9292585.1 hypothetical protein [Gracilimonas sediminicola]